MRRGTRLVFAAWALCLALFLFAEPAAAEKRVALVIGNNNYVAAPLINPVNDARDMAEALRRAEFEVIQVFNASRREMLAAVRDFGDRIKGGGVGLFFYAGHGLQVNGENYLAPVDARMTSADEVEDYCLRVSAVLRKMESAQNRLNIIILDACRNNPFTGTRGGSRGLAKMEAPKGSLLAYSTAPGAVAYDGKGQNGVYTANLLKHINTPGLEIGRMFRRVRVDVLEMTSDRQTPWESSSLTGSFYFQPGAQDSLEAGRPAAAESQESKRDLVLDASTAASSQAKPDPRQTPASEKPAEARRLAVLYFDTGEDRPDLKPLRKGLADMMITDLSLAPALDVVEREKLEAVIKEQNLQQNSRFDQAEAVKLGRLLGAELILVGAFFEMFGQLRIDARLVDAATGRVIKAGGVNGQKEDFFQLKDQLVWRIMKNLDQTLTDSFKPQDRQGPGFDQLQAFSEALVAYDRGNADQARRAAAAILDEHPEFEPARLLLARIDS